MVDLETRERTVTDVKLFMAEYKPDDYLRFSYHLYENGVYARENVVKQIHENYSEEDGQGTEGEDDYVAPKVIPADEKALFDSFISNYSDKAFAYVQKQKVNVGASVYEHSKGEILKVQVYQELDGRAYLSLTFQISGGGADSIEHTERIMVADLPAGLKTALVNWRNGKETGKKTELGI